MVKPNFTPQYDMNIKNQRLGKRERGMEGGREGEGGMIEWEGGMEGVRESGEVKN